MRCRQIGPVDATVEAKARVIYRVNLYVDILRRNPRAHPWLPSRPHRHVAREVKWAVADLRRQALEAHSKGAVGEASTLTYMRGKMEGHWGQMESARRDTPTPKPSASAPE